MILDVGLHNYIRLSSAKKSQEDFVYAAAVFAVLGDSESERSRSEAEAKGKIAFYASTRTYEPVLESDGWEGVLPELHVNPGRAIRREWLG